MTGNVVRIITERYREGGNNVGPEATSLDVNKEDGHKKDTRRVRRCGYSVWSDKGGRTGKERIYTSRKSTGPIATVTDARRMSALGT